MMPNDRLESIVSELPHDLQNEVADYAQYLLDRKDEKPAPFGPRFYICPVCFAAASHALVCHGDMMIACNANRPEDCKPLMDEEGNFNSRAPRWFLRAMVRASENQ